MISNAMKIIYDIINQSKIRQSNRNVVIIIISNLVKSKVLLYNISLTAGDITCDEVRLK